MRRVHVAAAVLIQDGKIYAAQRGYGEFKDYWEFPGGKVEPGETAEEALVREMAEELGVQVRCEHQICTLEMDYPSFHLSMDCFTVSLTAGSLQLKEHESALWLKPEELETVDWLPADRKLVEDYLLKGKF